jgi:hypothetical protein
MRKVLLFLIALASIAFGVCSPASAAQALDGSNQNQVKRALHVYLCNLQSPEEANSTGYQHGGRGLDGAAISVTRFARDRSCWLHARLSRGVVLRLPATLVAPTVLADWP